MKLTIDRSKWLRGEGATHSFLLRGTDGKMCCLGFLAQQLAPSEPISNMVSPAGVPKVPWPEGFIEPIRINGIDVYSNGNCDVLMTTNDDLHYTEARREELLKTEFERFNIEVEFVDSVGETNEVSD